MSKNNIEKFNANDGKSMHTSFSKEQQHNLGINLENPSDGGKELKSKVIGEAKTEKQSKQDNNESQESVMGVDMEDLQKILDHKNKNTRKVKDEIDTLKKEISDREKIDAEWNARVEEITRILNERERGFGINLDQPSDRGIELDPRREFGISKLITKNPLGDFMLGKFLERKKFHETEQEKTPEQIEIIKNILPKVANFVRKYGGVPVDINPEQIHILSKGDFNSRTARESDSDKEIIGGYYSVLEESVVIQDAKNDLANTATIVHELMHFNSFQSVQETPEGEYKLRRAGFGIYDSNQGSNKFFNAINEGITEELNIRFQREYFHLTPGLKEGMKENEQAREKWTDNFLQTYPESTHTHYYKEQYQDGIIVKNKSGVPEMHVTRSEERKMLNIVIDLLYEKNKNEVDSYGEKLFKSPDDVFKMFATSYLSGNILEVCRLIEKTMGKGTIKNIGEQK